MIKVAILDDSKKEQAKLGRTLASLGLDDVDFFSNSRDFSVANIEAYDLFIFDFILGSGATGLSIAKAIRPKTNAPIMLMSSQPELLNNIQVNGIVSTLLDKGNMDAVKESIDFCVSKIKLVSTMETQELHMNTIEMKLKNGNGI